MDQDNVIVDSGLPVMPTYTSAATGWSNYRALADIAAFTSNNTYVNAGVKPGQKYPANGTTYNFTDSAITNALIELTGTAGSGFAWNLVATKNFTQNNPATIPSANLVAMTNVSYTNPPMYGDGENSTTTSSSGEVGPAV